MIVKVIYPTSDLLINCKLSGSQSSQPYSEFSCSFPPFKYKTLEKVFINTFSVPCISFFIKGGAWKQLVFGRENWLDRAYIPQTTVCFWRIKPCLFEITVVSAQHAENFFYIMSESM